MSEDALRLAYANLLSPHVSGGTDPARLESELAGRFREAHAAVQRRRSSGEMGFYDLPYATETLATVKQLAEGFGQWFEDIVVLGIGGSGLGTVARAGRASSVPGGTSVPTTSGTTFRACTSSTTPTRSPSSASWDGSTSPRSCSMS